MEGVKRSIIIPTFTEEVTPMQASERIMYSTVRLEGITPNGITVGTGFFYFKDQRLYLVTNKHVIRGVTEGYFKMSRAFRDGALRPMIGETIQSPPFAEHLFVGHPNPNIDVSVTNVSELVNNLGQQGIRLCYAKITPDTAPTQKDIDTFISPLEDVVFVGYPDGLWDPQSLTPIMRKGITATPYCVDFRGEKVFLIDASVFPGSSGSPVFIVREGAYTTRDGSLYVGGDKIFFLGIVARTLSRDEYGEIDYGGNPTPLPIHTRTRQMIDLGVVFKASTIEETIAQYVLTLGKVS